MSSITPLLYPLNQGVDTYNPPIASKDLFFTQLIQIEPRLGRLQASRGLAAFQSLAASLGPGDALMGFGYYSLTQLLAVNFYAFSKTKVFWFDFSTGFFDPTPIYSGFTSSEDPYAVMPWYDGLFVTKPGRMVKLASNTATVVPGISAKYGIVANSHLYLGDVTDVARDKTRLRWSDLDAPESFDIQPDSSEAGFFSIEPPAIAIRGITYQRGNPVVYTDAGLWSGTAIGFPGGFVHQPLYPGVRLPYDYTVVQYKDIDYFIGEDNFYALNGFQVVPIGDAIWERFQSLLKVETNTKVRGFVDSRRDQIFWTFTRADNDQLWSVVYNYKEAKWSERDALNVTAWFDAPKFFLSGYTPIDEISAQIDTVSTSFDEDEGLDVLIPQLAAVVGQIGKVDGTVEPAIYSAVEGKVETFDFFYDSIDEVKTLIRAVVEFTGGGSPDLELEIGSRDSQFETISWSSPISVTNYKGKKAFFFRSTGIGKFIRLRFTWTNSNTNYIDDMRLVEIQKVQDVTTTSPN